MICKTVNINDDGLVLCLADMHHCQLFHVKQSKRVLLISVSWKRTFSAVIQRRCAELLSSLLSVWRQMLSRNYSRLR